MFEVIRRDGERWMKMKMKMKIKVKIFCIPLFAPEDEKRRKERLQRSITRSNERLENSLPSTFSMN